MSPEVCFDVHRKAKLARQIVCSCWWLGCLPFGDDLSFPRRQYGTIMIIISHVPHFAQEKTAHGWSLFVCKCLSHVSFVRMLLVQVSCNLHKRFLAVEAVVLLVIHSLPHTSYVRTSEKHPGLMTISLTAALTAAVKAEKLRSTSSRWITHVQSRCWSFPSHLHFS